MKRFSKIFIILMTALKLCQVGISTSIDSSISATRDFDASRQTISVEWWRRRRRQITQDYEEPDRNHDRGDGDGGMTAGNIDRREIRLGRGDRLMTDMTNIENVMLTAMAMFFDQLEMAMYLSLYKLKLIYTTLIEPLIP